MSPKHREQIGPAIWEFLWLINKVTRETDEADGERWGHVLGGKTLTAQQITDDLGGNLRTTQANLKRLEDHEYIRTRRQQYGLQIDVRRSIRWLKRSNDKVGELVTVYRAVPGIKPDGRDYGFFGQAVKDYGEAEVVRALQVLKDFTSAGGKVRNPHGYITGILQRNDGKPLPATRKKTPAAPAAAGVEDEKPPVTPLEIWESRKLTKIEKGRLLRVPDCPKCNKDGFVTWKPDPDAGIQKPRSYPCDCWHNPDKYK